MNDINNKYLNTVSSKLKKVSMMKTKKLKDWCIIIIVIL